MKKHISFPSIEQFRHVVASVNRQANYVGADVNGDAIYDPNLPKPVLTFKGTVKLHGTNAGVCYNNEDGFWIQSRENIITPTSEVFYKIDFEDGTSTMINEEEFNLMNKKIGDSISF